MQQVYIKMPESASDEHHHSTESISRTAEKRVASLNLSPAHRQMLLEESGIDPEIAAERGYWTARNRTQLTDRPKYQRRAPSLVIPTYSPDGETTRTRLRPDTPRRNRKNKKIKYEQPGGEGLIIDVHPRNLNRIQDASEDLWITEGEKKADSLTSRGLCAIALFGVECWSKDGELLPCWNSVALSGREIYVAYDSDVMVKPEVLNALERLTGALEARGATVRVVYLPDAEDGGRHGVDDYLVAGGTVEAMYEMAQPFEPAAATTERLSRNDKLRAAIDGLWARWEAMPTNTAVNATRKSLVRFYIRQAEKYGKLKAGDVQVSVSQRAAAEECQISQPSVAKNLAAVEEAGVLCRVKAEPDKPAAVVLRVGCALSNQSEGLRGRERESPTTEQGERVSSTGLASHGDYSVRTEQGPHSAAGSHRGDYSVRTPRAEVPEMRWSRAIISWKLDEFGFRVYEIEPLVRHGKKRQHIVEYLVDSGGRVSVDELMERFAGKSTRRSDFKRRTLGPLADDPQIIEVDGDAVCLTPGWQGAVDNARKLVQEPEDSDRQRVRHELQRAAFHGRDEHPADHSPTYAEMDAAREERERRWREQEESRSALAAAMREYLLQNPHRADEPAGWIGTTCWALGIYDGKPEPAESKAALAELGGAENVLAEMREAS